jgi:hypothetical protein
MKILRQERCRRFVEERFTFLTTRGTHVGRGGDRTHRVLLSDRFQRELIARTDC